MAKGGRASREFLEDVKKRCCKVNIDEKIQEKEGRGDEVELGERGGGSCNREPEAGSSGESM